MRIRADRGDGEWSEYSSALFPAALSRFVVAGAAGGIHVEFTGGDTIQVFYHTTTTFASAALLGSVSGGRGDVALAAGAYYVWARPVGAGGAVGAEIGPIAVVAEDLATGGSSGTGGAPGEGPGQDGGPGDSDSEGGPGGDSSSGET